MKTIVSRLEHVRLVRFMLTLTNGAGAIPFDFGFVASSNIQEATPVDSESTIKQKTIEMKNYFRFENEINVFKCFCFRVRFESTGDKLYIAFNGFYFILLEKITMITQWQNNL